MPFLKQGESAQVSVSANEYLFVSAFRNAVCSVNVPLGQPGGPSAVVNGTLQAFGPFTQAITATVGAQIGDIEYVTGTRANFQGVYPYALGQTAVPMILPSSGTANTTGQITHTTVLPYQPSGVVMIYLPAGVVTAGNAGTGAGMYPVIYSTTAICQIQGTGIVTANGAYTQTTAADITLATVVVPGGAMGGNGALRVTPEFSYPNNANSKTLKAVLATTAYLSLVVSTTVAFFGTTMIRNRGSQSQQTSNNWLNGTTAAAVRVNGTVDTSVNQNLTFTGQIAVATDFFILEGYTVEVLPMP